MSRTSEYVSYGLIAAALGLTIVAVVDRDRPTTKEQSARAGLLLRVFRPDEITRITLERRNEKIELVREGDGWKLISPRIARADFLAVTSLLNALQGARSERALGNVQGSERAQLGLDSPKSKVEIAMNGVTLRLSLGGPAPGAGEGDAGALASYVEVSPYGDEKGGVFVVTPDVAAALDRGSDSFREASLLGHQSPTFAKIDVMGKFSLTHATNGSWRLPSGQRASADAVDGLLIALYETKAAPFLPDTTPVDTSLGGVIDITLTSGNKVSLSVGGPCPGDPKQVVAKVESVGCVPQLVAARLLNPIATYLDPRAFWLQPGPESAKISEIEAITIESGGAKLVDGERRGDGLHLRIPSDEQIDAAATDRYFTRLAAISGTIVESPDLAALGLSPPAGRAVLRRRVAPTMLMAGGDGGSQLSEQIVEIGTPNKDFIHLRRLDDGVVLRVPLELAQPLRAAAVHELRSPNLINITGEINRVHVRPESAIAFELSRKSGLWELISPAGFGADPTAVTSITSTLGSLLCLRWAADKDDGTFGFDKPTVTIDVEHEAKPNEPATFTIELGKDSADANGGVYARVKGRDQVCVLPIGKREALLRPPVDTRNVGFDPTVTPRIAITKGTRSRLLQYSDVTKAWSDATDAGSDFVARKLADAVRGLRAEGLVHLGPPKPEEGFDTPTMVLAGSDGAAIKKKLIVGTLAKLNDMPIYYVRIDGVDATWAVLRGDLDNIATLL